MQNDIPQDLDFDDLKPTQIPVKLQGKSYVLVEAFGDAVAKWRNSQTNSTRVLIGEGDKRVVSLGNMADSECVLVALCLFSTDSEGKLRLLPTGAIDTKWRVPVEVVRTWPNRVVSKLFETAKRISGLVEGQEKQAQQRRQEKKPEGAQTEE